jgi:MFS family permease
MASMAGNQLTVIAVQFQVYRETHSSWMVGVASLCQLGPLLVGSLWGGAAGDHRDRKRILVVTSFVLFFFSAALGLNAMSTHPNLFAIIALSSVAAGVTGFSNPSRNAAIPRLVREELLVGAYSLNQVTIQTATVGGPALGGLLITVGSSAACYWVDAGTFLILTLATASMSPLKPLVERTTISTMRSIRDGFGYVRTHVTAQCVYLADLNAMIFGMPTSLFPAIAVTWYHGGAGMLGLLNAAPGIGALLGALTTRWVEHIKRRGRGVVFAVAGWGLAIVAFGLTHNAWIGLAMLAVAGWADVISAVLRNTILQTTIADEFRGRLSAIQMAVVTGGPRLGNFEAGAVAGLGGLGLSVISGGAACVVGIGALAGWRRSFWRERAGEAS